MTNEFFAPRISADTAAFWEGCKEHRLLGQRCTACGAVRWPAAWLCPECLSEETERADLGAQGVIYSYTVFRRPFHPSLEEKLPYVVAAVDIGGVRMISNIVGCDPVEVCCGAKVRLVWADGEACVRPVFQLEE